MASLNQVSIELQVTGERQATQSLKRYSDASDKLTRSVLNAAGKIENTTNAWDRANKLFEKGILNSKGLQAAQTQLARELAVVNGYVKTNGALNTQKALAELKAVQATKAATAAEAQANAERQRAQQTYNQLRATIDQSYAARMRLKKAADTLRAAERQGLITREQAIEQLRQYRELQTSTSVSVNSFGDANHHASRRMNGMGMAVQQTGYQVGDFLVQVQGGTNWMVAFGQQATQLVGILPMMGAQLGLSVTKLIGISTVLGIGIPLLTAFGAAIMRTRQEAEEATNSFGELGTAINDLEKYSIDLVEGNERIKDSFQNIINIVKEVKSEALRARLDEIIKPYEDQIRSFEKRMANFLRFGGQRGSFREPQIDVLGFDNLENAAQAYSLIRGIQGETKEELAESLVLTELWLRGSGLLTDEIKNILTLYADIVDLQEQATEETEVINQALQRQVTHQTQIANIQKEINAGVQEIITNRDAELQKQQDRITLARAELEFGKESSEYKNAQAVIEERILREQLAQNDILGNNADKIIEAWKEANNLEQEVSDSAASARELAGALNDAASAMSSLQSFGQGLEKSLEVARAKAVAIKNETNEAAAGQVAGMRFDLEARTQAAIAAGADPLVARAEAAISSATIDQLEQQRRQNAAARRASRGSGVGGGSSATKTQEDYLAKLQSEAELKLRLIGLTEEQQRYQEIVNELKDRELLVGGKLSDQQEARIQQIIKMEEETRNLMERQKERENLERKVQQTIESGLMSLLDGSASVEDAFKTMIRAILKEIAMKAIVEPIATGIKGLFFEKGGAFNNGNVIPFANGGVVSSPTMFSMAGSQTGLMGEAGPEAIMPLKRGKGGKLGVVAEGGGGNVTVENHFHIAANGDESVKRIIAQEAPRIANLTQKQIIDQRRRGGTMKAAFG